MCFVFNITSAETTLPLFHVLLEVYNINHVDDKGLDTITHKGGSFL